MITRLKYGNTNTFLIRGESGKLLVDTDYAGTLPGFYRAIKEAGIRVSDIDYVLATHYHPDHMGLISELMKQGVRLLLLDSGECFVGDLEPMEYLDAYEEKAALQRDWERIMGHSPKVIYYAHRPPKLL